MYFSLDCRLPGAGLDPAALSVNETVAVEMVLLSQCSSRSRRSSKEQLLQLFGHPACKRSSSHTQYSKYTFVLIVISFYQILPEEFQLIHVIEMNRCCSSTVFGVNLTYREPLRTSAGRIPCRRRTVDCWLRAHIRTVLVFSWSVSERYHVSSKYPLPRIHSSSSILRKQGAPRWESNRIYWNYLLALVC